MFASGLSVTGGLAGVLSEVSSALNGAHMNHGWLVGNCLRRFSVVTPSAVEPEPTKNHSFVGAQPQLLHPQAPTSLRAPCTLSELGLPKLSEEDLRGIMWSGLALAAECYQGKHPTVKSMLKKCHRHSSHLSWGGSGTTPLLRSRPYSMWEGIPRRSYTHLNHDFRSRPYSIWAGLPRETYPHIKHALGSLQRVWCRSLSVYHLEEVANQEPDNAKAQAEYLQALLDSDPNYIMRRVESGRYASNTNVKHIYSKAADLVHRAPPSFSSEGLDGNVSGFRPFDSNQERLGTFENPLVMRMTKKFSFKEEMWSLFKSALGLIIGCVVLMLVLSSTIMNSVKTSTNKMQTKYSPDSTEKNYTFDDVQGIDEAKEEVQEVVNFLKNPEKFKRLGAKLPTGVLIIGPPGTGKTLLAKAVAGEAQVPFIFVSGSEFDEMFVGVGASRVRKLFATAKSLKPCVLFIDELDAVGGKRNSSPMHPYSRMTLNQLLVELDGFNELEGVIVMGATNFPEALDSALTRPGRFDNQIVLTMPDIRARYKILELHSKKIKLSHDVDLEGIARATAGFSGADLANLVNQAALRGCLENNDSVTIQDLEYARERIAMGRERRSAVVGKRDLYLTAYHEAGHAIVALFTPGMDTIYKATIVPRGTALGMVSYIPDGDVLLHSKKEMLAIIDTAMAGHVSEELIMGPENVTSGAFSDFQKATNIATNMVTKFGMSSRIGPVIHDLEKCGPEVKKKIDEEIERILKDSYGRAKELLQTHAVEHKRLAEALLKYETLESSEIKLVIANKPLNRKL